MTAEFPNLFSGTVINYFRGFNLFSLSFYIYWYGVLIAVGIVLAYIYANFRAEKTFGISRDRMFDVVFACVIGGFLCGRIYYCVFRTLDPDSPTKYNFITTFTTIRDGGIAIYGGIIGAVLTGLIFCKLRKVNFRAMADLASLGFLIGQTIGRWGNFINQEAYGAECDKDWLFAMTGNRIAEEMGSGVYVHPCFLYESAWCLVGFILLHFYSKKLHTYDGEVALLYVAWYGLGRMFIEGLRTDSLYWGKFRVSQVLAFASCIAATVLFVIFKILAKKKNWVLYVNTEESKALIAADNEKSNSKKQKKEKQAKSILAEELDDTAENEENIPEEITKDDNAADNENSTENSDEKDENNNEGE